MVVLPLPGGPNRKIDFPEFTAGPSCASVSRGMTMCANARTSSSCVTEMLLMVWRFTASRYDASGTGALPTYWLRASASWAFSEPRSMMTNW